LSSATSIPVSTVSWDPRILAILASGNTRRGEAVAAQTCAACHGDKGLSQSMAPGPVFPSLAGQSPFAIYKQLHDFRSGARVNAQMSAVAKTLAVEDLAAVAAYYASASTEYAAIGRRQLLGDADIEKLADEGDSHRRLPACLACHVNGAGGPTNIRAVTNPVDTVVFSAGTTATGAYTVNVSGTRSAALVSFAQGTVTLAGGNLAVGAFSTPAGVSATVTSVVSGLGSGVLKSGDGTLTFSAANTFTGGMSVTGGKIVLANADARPLTTGEGCRAELVEHLTRGVDWVKAVEVMSARGVGQFAEIGPGKVLTGLIKRINAESEAVAVDEQSAPNRFNLPDFLSVT
jgi:autotransporter-associated beta strand protein